MPSYLIQNSQARSIPSATDEQIKKAYRLKSKEFHPDSMNSDSSEMFESMTQARDLIFEYRKQKDESQKLAHII